MPCAVWGAGVQYRHCWCQLCNFLFLERVAFFCFFFIWGTRNVHIVTGLSKELLCSFRWGGVWGWWKWGRQSTWESFLSQCVGVDGGYSHCAVDGSHGTNGQGVAWKEGKKGENNLLFGTEHLWLAEVHCRLKTFLTNNKPHPFTTPAHYSGQYWSSHTGCISFFFLILCGWCDREASGTRGPELEFHYPQTFFASPVPSAGHTDDDGVDAAAIAGSSLVCYPAHFTQHGRTAGQPERCHVQNRIYFCFVFWLRTLPPVTMTTMMKTTTTKKGQMHFLHFLIISKAMYHCFL